MAKTATKGKSVKKGRYPKLRADFKREWLKALRSGDYQQIQSQLKDKVRDGDGTPTSGVGFCCLGVACVVGRVKFDSNAACPPTKFQTKVGLTPKTCDILVKKNDERMWSFRRIATWIEKHL